MSRVNYETLGKLIEMDERDLEFERVTNSIDVVDIEYGVDVIFDYYRRHGFPHYKIREDEKHDHMKKLRKFDVDTIFIDNQIVQTMHCLRLAWSYFPFFWEIKCGNSMNSPMETFLNDDKFKATIKKCWTWEQKHYKGENPNSTSTRFHENRLRQSIKIYSGTQSVSNFRPTAAKLIYEKFGGDGVIWDPSSGWGGRLLGFLSAKNTKHYIGTEPSTRTYNGLLKMSKEFSYLGKKVDIYKQGSEDFIPNKSSLDLCFTSPPYFDTEKYSDESTQSYIKFPSGDEWVNGFLRKTIENCYYGLKKGGYMLYNIANTAKYKFIEEETVRISKELGFAQEDTLQLTLSSVMGAGYKYEPVFVFKKIGESMLEREVEKLLKVHYADMPGLDTETQMLFKQLEWGINLGSNTMYLTYEIDTDQLYSVMTRFDNFIQYNDGKEDVNLVISSYGGDVYAMLGTIDYFNSLPVKVNTHCIGACMSAAAVILACGTGKRTMTENSTVMVHEGSAFEVGKTSDVIKGADHMKKLQTNINRILGDVTNKSQEFWEDVSKQDTYLTSEECLEYGIVDEIT